MCPLSTDNRISKERTRNIRLTGSAVVRRGRGRGKLLRKYLEKKLIGRPWRRWEMCRVWRRTEIHSFFWGGELE